MRVEPHTSHAPAGSALMKVHAMQLHEEEEWSEENEEDDEAEHKVVEAPEEAVETGGDKDKSAPSTALRTPLGPDDDGAEGLRGGLDLAVGCCLCVASRRSTAASRASSTATRLLLLLLLLLLLMLLLYPPRVCATPTSARPPPCERALPMLGLLPLLAPPTPSLFPPVIFHALSLFCFAFAATASDSSPWLNSPVC